MTKKNLRLIKDLQYLNLFYYAFEWFSIPYATLTLFITYSCYFIIENTTNYKKITDKMFKSKLKLQK